MKVLVYRDLNIKEKDHRLKKIVDCFQQNDFASADIKKMPNTGYYRAKLDYENRLLFRFGRYEGEMYVLLLEEIHCHAYGKSRFMRGAVIDENKLIPVANEKQLQQNDVTELVYLNKHHPQFHLLDKLISFDNEQHKIYLQKLPLIIIGSAGSGKTALVLEKIKALKGNILYVTHSPFLVQNASSLYYANYYENETQEIDFLSYNELINTIKVVEGKPVTFKNFSQWFMRFRQASPIKDAYKLFEEFNGVITGMRVDKACMSRGDYASLGVRQSIFLETERDDVYDLFEKYLEWMKQENLTDINLTSYDWLQHATAKYDFIVADEIQDFTNIQIFLALKLVLKKEQFIFCGDSNQIVHPNFFSWTALKRMFYENEIEHENVHILQSNYRNSPEVTELANRLLKIKNLRFGSIDRESNYLVQTISSKKGEVVFLRDKPNILKELNEKTKASTQFAVLVLNEDDKAKAKTIFNTPLIFSIQEAKGLEYNNIIMVNFISQYEKVYREIIQGITNGDIEKINELEYARARDKSDKSLDAYKFYINALYVAMTRAIENLYLVESNDKHDLLGLLNLLQAKEQLQMRDQKSTLDEWNREARKLEMQGKEEQARLIRENILGNKIPDWKVLTIKEFNDLELKAYNRKTEDKKARDKVFDYALVYNKSEVFNYLSTFGYKRAFDANYQHERSSIYRRFYAIYKSDDVKMVDNNIAKYGLNYRDEFNLTPLMAAAHAGSLKIVKHLLNLGADPELTDNYGRNAMQITLAQTILSKDYAKNKLEVIYPLVLTDSIKVQVNNQLVKIDNHKVEYFLINFLIALQDALSQQRKFYEEYGVKAGDLANAVELFPETIVPAFRKVKTYWSGVLARNERNFEKGRKILLRNSRGIYVLNPAMELLIKDTAINIVNHLDYGSKDIYNFNQDTKEWVNTFEINELSKLKDELTEEYFRQKREKDHQQRLAALRIKEQKAMFYNKYGQPKF